MINRRRAETMNKDHPLVALVEWLKGEYANVNGSIEAMLKEGFITFGALWYLFPKGTKVYGTYLPRVPPVLIARRSRFCLQFQSWYGGEYFSVQKHYLQ